MVFFSLYNLPHVEDQTINRLIKEVGKAAGIDAYDIIKITGHQDLEMLRKYIKVDQLDVVQKLTDKYDYFR